MTQASYQTKARPSPWWYALVAVAWIASAVVFSVVAIKPFVDILSTDVTQIVNGDTVSIGSDGLSVYVESDDALGACTLTADGADPVRMDTVDSIGTEFEVDTTGPTLQAYASTPDGLSAGSYVISCEGGESTIMATGERIDESALEQSLGWGFIISLILGVLGLALLITLLIKRHNSKSRIRAEQQSAAYYGAWAAQGYSAPEGTYPPAPYDPYGQQQQQGYGSPQGYASPPADQYGQPPSPAQPYGQPPQPPQPGYDPYGQQPPPAADPYAQQPPADPYAQPPAEQPAADPYPGGPSDSSPDTSSSGPSSDGAASDDGASGDSSPSSDSGSSDSGSSDSNKD